LRANAVKESAMDLDARASTHPVLQSIANEAQAANAFDDISYEKGQSILRMLETWLGEAAFRDGIRHYLRQHAFSNTTTADLWRVLETTSGRPVSAVANDWIERGGFPVVTVTAATVGSQPALALQQTRFSLHMADAVTAPWPIPITAFELAPGAEPQTRLFDTVEGRLPWSGAAVKLNAGNTGFYRVHYDDTLAAALRDHLHLLPMDDRLNLLSDTWALVRANRVPVSRYLELAARIDADAHPVLVEQVISTFEYIDQLQRGRAGRHAFQIWACAALQPVMLRLVRTETPGESPLDAALRAKLIRLLGIFGDRPTLAWAHAQFAAFLQDPTAVSGNLAGPMLQLVGRHADAATHEQLRELARRSLTTAEKRRAYAGMQAATDPALVRATLDLTLSGEMPAAEANRNLERLAATCEQPELVLDYALQHFDALLARLGSFEAYGYLPGIMDAFSDEARAEQLLRLTAEKFPADAVTIAARTAEAIRDNARFKQSVLPEIDAWIRTQHTPSPE
jgi:aminopeptidase N